MIGRWPHLLGSALWLLAAITAWRLHLSVSEWITLYGGGVAVGWLGARLWPRPGSGLAAGGLFVSMPLLQFNIAAVQPVMLLLMVGWLAGIDAFERTGRPGWLALSTAAASAGAAASGAAFLVMPLLVLAGLLALWLRDQPPRVSVTVMVGMLLVGAAALAPFAGYLARHPEWITSRAAAYHLYDTERFTARQGLREIVSWVGLTVRSETYWHYFDPSFLFLRAAEGGPWFRGQVLPLAAMALLPIGVLSVTARVTTRARLLLVAGLAAAPVPGAVIAQPPVGAWFVAAAPFAALLTYAGLAHLLAGERRLSRVAGILLAGAVVTSAVVLAFTA